MLDDVRGNDPVEGSLFRCGRCKRTDLTILLESTVHVDEVLEGKPVVVGVGRAEHRGEVDVDIADVGLVLPDHGREERPDLQPMPDRRIQVTEHPSPARVEGGGAHPLFFRGSTYRPATRLGHQNSLRMETSPQRGHWAAWEP